MSPRTSALPQSWAHELRTQRRTRYALLGMVGTSLVLAHALGMFIPGRTPGNTLPTGFQRTEHVIPMETLRNVLALDRMGSLPNSDNPHRDPLTFGVSKIPATKPLVPALAPPAVPPSERDLEWATRPSGLRYLGFFHPLGTPRRAAFLDGPSPRILSTGVLVKQGWRLVEVFPDKAIFQSLKYHDMFHTLEAVDANREGA